MTCEMCGECGPVDDAGHCRLCALELEADRKETNAPDDDHPTDPCAAPGPDWEPVL